MNLLTPENVSKVTADFAGNRFRPPEDAWEILEHFARDLNRCDKGLRQKLALKAIRDCIHAEAVFWYPGPGSDASEIVSECALPAAWCSAFAHKLIEGTPGLDGRLLRSVLPAGPPTSPFNPYSAALVRVSRTHGNWIVALNFSKRCLQVADLRIMALARRILVNQRRASDLTARMTDTLAWLVQCLTTSIDAHQPQASGHSERVAKLAVAIGKRMRLPASVLNDLYFAGLLHDIGITGVPQSVLLKPAKLTDAEYAVVKTYPIIGDGILGSMKQLGHLRPTVRHHHERFDGRGYPDGLSGDDIPLTSRILSVAEAFDAMRSSRPYRPAFAKKEVDDILADGAGKQWDPCVVEHYMLGRPHFHACCEPAAASQAESAVERVVHDWNVDSSNNATLGGDSDRRGPPGTEGDSP